MNRTEQPSQPRVTQMLKVAQVAQLLSMSRSAVYGLMDRGELQYIKLGKSRRVALDAVQRMIADNTIGAK